MSETHTGGCLCGAVRYQVRGAPAIGLVCHCKFCQRRLGSAFAVVAYFDADAVEFMQGDLGEYEHRSDESGRWLRINFCPRCGTPVSHTAEGRPGMRAISAGTFDDPQWFAIDRHVWTNSKQNWVEVPEGIAIFERGSIPQTSTP